MAARDFPFYDGRPVRLSVAQWALVMAAVVAGFAALVSPIPWPGGRLSDFIPALLFVALPLGALALVAPGHWRALFARVGWRELGWVLLFALLNLAVTLCVGLVVRRFAEVQANPAAAMLAGLDTPGRLLFLAKTLPQLLGEELMTMLPLLALMAWFTQGLGFSRRTALIGAWLLSSLMFGLVHLPTYGWNWVQCIAIIGSARLVLSLAYLRTRNLWVSAGAHIVNDWALFGAGLWAAALTP